MRSSFEALHDEIRPLRMLDEEGAGAPAPPHALAGAVMAVLAVVIPALVVLLL